MLKGIKAIFFDLDGTVADTVQVIRIAVNSVRETFSLAPLDYAGVRRGINHGIRHLMKITVAQDLGDTSDGMLDRLCEIYPQRFAKCFNDIDDPFDGMREAIYELKRRGYRIAMISNKPDEFVRPQIDKLFGAGVFEVARGAVGNTRIKPDPEFTYSVIKELDAELLPEECAIVGDSNVDIQTARNAGMKCVSVTWGYIDTKLLLELNPDEVVDRPEQLLEVFE